jgi:hypothetical protein
MSSNGEGKSDLVFIGHERVADWLNVLAQAAFLYTSHCASNSSTLRSSLAAYYTVGSLDKNEKLGWICEMGAGRVR